FSRQLFSQETSNEMDAVYGMDPLLYNGKQYSYFFPLGTVGHQYLFSEDYIIGEVTIKGICYQRIVLNYDIYNQLFLLKYTNASGTSNIICISTAWLEGFKLGELDFKYLSFTDGPRFYQVLGDGPDYILIYWWKELILEPTIGKRNFAFTPAIKNRYILLDNKLMPFRNKRTLISLFKPENKQEIKDYIQHNRIRIKKASDKSMIDLINFIGKL
ncbi:MAG TPA: hypothetical protein PKL65_14515, partial [Bacteroidales bacterium]|nr:hypothetical protein [Bacteroidales bacterium]